MNKFVKTLVHFCLIILMFVCVDYVATTHFHLSGKIAFLIGGIIVGLYIITLEVFSLSE